MRLIQKRVFLAFAIIVALFLGLLFLVAPQNEDLFKEKSESESKIENQKLNFTLSEKQGSDSPNATSKSIEQPKHITSDVELQIPIPLGAKLPAAFMDEGNPEDSEGVKELLLSLEKEFQEEYETELRKGLTPEEAWENARSKSDERYQALFGQDAYLEALNLAAEEARTDWETRQ
jgi:hypothetical protein